MCRVFGLTGDQGVVIPHQNIGNLMLRDDVVEAIREEKFHVYAIKTIDEGIEILTNCSSGERQDDGSYPKGTVNQLVENRLLELDKSMRGYYQGLLATTG